MSDRVILPPFYKGMQKTGCFGAAYKGVMNLVSISSDVIRGYNDTIILCLLVEKPSYGYEISKQIRITSKEKYVIKETTLYSAFTRMEKNGYIESFSNEVAAGGKKRTYYRITDRGRDYYREKCEEWSVTKEVIESFILKERIYNGDNKDVH